MPVKSFLMADLRNKGPSSPASFHRSHVGSGTYNRFEPLSPAPRTFVFGKRLLSDDNAEGNAAKLPRFDPSKVFDQLKVHDSALETARKAIATADAAIADHCKADDGGVGTALSNLSAALTSIIKGNEVLKSALLDSCQVNKVTAKNPTADPSQPPPKKGGMSQTGQGPSKPAKPQLTEEELTAIKVKKAVREAEKKTVIFDLNLGTAPTINKESISKKVTMALHEKGREGDHDWALQDAADMLDDVLSCAQLEFLGAGTRKFYNSSNASDPRNGKWCTVPVRLEFKNKDTRSQAEATIRKVCKVKCSVPYPKKLRQMIKEMITEGKRLRDKCYIRIKVDIDNLSVSAYARCGDRWEPLNITQRIPLDIMARTELPILNQMELTESLLQNPQIEEIHLS